MSKEAGDFLALRTEEMEFVVTMDVVHRGGIDITVITLPDKNPIKCRRRRYPTRHETRFQTPFSRFPRVIRWLRR